MRTLITLLITLVTFTSVAMAQSNKDKLEIGVQTTSLTVFYPDAAFDDTKAGIGGRVTYNFNRSIAAEAEVNFFPQSQLIFEYVGDTIIRYGEIRFPGLPPSFTIPSVTRHNLQVSSGIGFRF